MNGSTIINKALVDENTDLEFTIKDKIMIGKPWPEDFETEGIGKLLLKQFNDFPNHIGQINVQTGEKTTFAEFKDRSIRCALWLKKQGIGKGDVVSTSIPLQNDDYVPVLAALYIGAVTNPWYYQLDPDTAEHFFKLIKPKIMFVWEEEIDVLVSAAKNVQVDCKFVVVGKHPDYPSLTDLMAEQEQTEVDEFRHVEPEDPKKQVGALLSSSGTTNVSKIIMWSYENVVKQRYHYAITRTHSNFLIYSLFAWNTGFSFFITCIRKLLTRILHTEFSVEGTAAVIEKFKVNLAFLTPETVVQLYKSDVFKKYDFSKFETLFVGGSKLCCSILEATRKALPNTLVINSFGITEAGGELAVQTKKWKTKDSIGRIIGSVQLKVVDLKSGLTLGANQEGEIYFKVDNLMMGYLNNPEETKEVIDDEGWCHSGDLGYYDENGELWITDRIKQMFTFRGDHLSTSAIEDILLQHPGVADAAVMPMKHEIDIERPFAFVVKNPGVEVSTEELIELPVSHYESYRLGEVAFVNKIPYNCNGKKSIKDLINMVKAYVKEYQAPSF